MNDKLPPFSRPPSSSFSYLTWDKNKPMLLYFVYSQQLKQFFKYPRKKSRDMMNNHEYSGKTALPKVVHNQFLCTVVERFSKTVTSEA